LVIERWLADGDDFDLESFFTGEVLPSLKGHIIFLKKIWDNEGAAATRYLGMRATPGVGLRVVAGIHQFLGLDTEQRPVFL